MIDILLVVASSAREKEYLPALEQGGYRLRLREPDWYEHRLLKGPDTDLNLHVLSDECEEIARMLRFRDRLRRNAEDRARYEQVKRELAEKEWASVEDYATAKAPVVEEILTKAG